MPTPKSPEKQSVRRPPPGGKQSAPPLSAKGRVHAKSVKKPSVTEVGGERTEARAPFDSAMNRADELLRQMTIEEKAMQLSCVIPIALIGPDGLMRNQLDALIGRGIGHVAGMGLLGHKSPETVAKSVNAIQRYLLTETRLKIPAIFHNEALNGVVSPGFTAFPTAIGLAATWDP